MKSERVYLWVRDFITTFGYGPTYREIARGLDRDVKSVYQSISILVRDGWISVSRDSYADRAHYRGIGIVDRRG